MRRIFSFVAAVAAIATVSCNKELQYEEPVAPAGETVTFTASVDGADTKTVLEGNRSYWVNGDAITIHNGTKGFEFSTELEENSLKAEFAYTGNDFTAENGVMAVYPAGDYAADVEAKTVKAHIPTWQQAQAGTYQKDAALAVAYSDDKSLSFRNAAALLKFTVKNDNVSHVTFFGNDNEPITGDVVVALDDDNTIKSVTCLETLTSEGEGENKTEEMKFRTWVECFAWHDDDHQFFSVGETYYIAIAPTAFDEGYGVELKINGVNHKVKSYSGSKELKAGVIYDLGELEYEAPATTSTVYLKAGIWDSDAAWFAAYFFGGAGNQTVKMTASGNEGVWQASVPSGFENVIFCRMNPEFSEFGWDKWEGEGDAAKEVENRVWNQSADLTIPVDDVNCYVVSNWETGMWMTLEDATAPQQAGQPSAWALAGTFNEWGNLAMLTTDVDGLFVAEDVVLGAYDELKVKAASSWDTTYGGGINNLQPNSWMTVYNNGANIAVTTAGTYDVYFDLNSTRLYLVTAGTSYNSATEQNTDGPAPSNLTWYIVGSFNDWNPGDPEYKMTLEGDYYVYRNFEAPAGCEVKFAPGKWSGDKGGQGEAFVVNKGFATGGQNISVAKGTYDVYFRMDGAMYWFMNPGSKPE